MTKSKMSAITPMVLAYSPMAETAYRTTRAAYRLHQKYGDQARGAARLIGKAYKAYAAGRQSKKRRTYAQRTAEIGNNADTANAKRDLDSEYDTLGTRALKQMNITALAKTSTNDINERQRDLVEFIGAKICMEMRNELTDPLNVNVAVIHPKKAQTVSANGFFRGYGNARSVDFSTVLSSNDMHCLPINADEYTILRHKRFTLAAAPGSTKYADNVGASFAKVQFYVKLKRQIRYENNSSLAVEGNVYLVWWCDKILMDASSPAVAGALPYDVKIYKYFKETYN